MAAPERKRRAYQATVNDAGFMSPEDKTKLAALSTPATETWAAATGTADRTTFATYTAQDITATYVEAEVQAIDDHVLVLSQRLKALIDDLLEAGVITTA